MKSIPLLLLLALSAIALGQSKPQSGGYVPVVSHPSDPSTITQVGFGANGNGGSDTTESVDRDRLTVSYFGRGRQHYASPSYTHWRFDDGRPQYAVGATAYLGDGDDHSTTFEIFSESLLRRGRKDRGLEDLFIDPRVSVLESSNALGYTASLNVYRQLAGNIGERSSGRFIGSQELWTFAGVRNLGSAGSEHYNLMTYTVGLEGSDPFLKGHVEPGIFPTWVYAARLNLGASQYRLNEGEFDLAYSVEHGRIVFAGNISTENRYGLHLSFSL